MLSRKYYGQIADIFNEHNFNLPRMNKEQQKSFDELVDSFCLMLKCDNPNFQQDKFRDAIYNR